MSVAAPLQTATTKQQSSSGSLLLQRKCACGGAPGLTEECEDCHRKRVTGQSRPLIQAKLTISDPGDAYEHEAEEVAERVMRLPGRETGGETKLRSARPSADLGVPMGASVPMQALPIVHEVLRSPGQPLGLATRAFFEPRFGHDFGLVRVHMDSKAAESARQIDARAFTVRQDIVFGAGEYRPESTEGKRLLAHELTHVTQQAHSTPLSAYHSTAALPERDGSRFNLEAQFHAPSHDRAQPQADGGASEAVVSRSTNRMSRVPSSMQRQPLLQGSQMVRATDVSFGTELGILDLWECLRHGWRCYESCEKPNARSNCKECCTKALNRCLDIGVWITREGGCSGRD